jgi:purine-cytosine permease-like protein
MVIFIITACVVMTIINIVIYYMLRKRDSQYYLYFLTRVSKNRAVKILTDYQYPFVIVNSMIMVEVPPKPE